MSLAGEGGGDLLLSPRALDGFVRSRTPVWLGQLLKTEFEDDIALEDLFANCWALGRVAECAQALMKGTSYRTPSQQLGDRPYRATINDIERFHGLCQTLNIPHESRITLADAEQRRASGAVLIGQCLWSVSKALRERGFIDQVPEFAPTAEHVKLRRSMPTEVNRSRVQHFNQSAETSPVKMPKGGGSAQPATSATITNVAVSTEAPALPSAAAAAVEEELDQEELELEVEPGLGTPADKQRPSASDPLSLHGWLPDDVNAQAARSAAADSPSCVVQPQNNSNSSAALAAIVQKDYQDYQQEREVPALEGQGFAGGAGLDVLQAILSPGHSKPSHCHLLNAILHTDAPADDHHSAVEKGLSGEESRTKRSLKLTIAGIGAGAGNNGDDSVLSSGRNAGELSSKPDSARYVHMVGKKKEKYGSQGWGGSLLVAVAGVALLVVAAVNGGKKDGQRQRRKEGTSHRRESVQHQGRW